MKENTREISILKQRILQYLDSKGVSKYECYKNTGITNGVLSQANGMSEDNLLRFLSYYNDISPDWLLAGHGSMLRTEQAQPVPQPAVQPAVHQDSSPGEATVYYKMYKEEKAEKESKIEEIGALKLKISQLESNKLATPKAKIDTQSKEPKAPDHPPFAFNSGFEAFTSDSLNKSGESFTPTAKPTSLKRSSDAKT